MEPRTITGDVSVSAQICAEDLPAIAAQGYRSVICNRPDGEAADQPAYGEIEAAARAAGLEIRNMPIVAGTLDHGDAAAFGAALEELPKPILAYCRTGTRSAMLWSISQAGKLSAAEILAKTRAAGYDMSGVVRQITPK